MELSRSRPYRKNDNRHIKQKNYTHVRLLLGCDRFEHLELVEPLNEVLRQWSQWNNLYGAQRRLQRKERQADGKVKRHHEKRASPPCARLLAREDLSAGQKSKLQAQRAAHAPIEMNASIEAKLPVVYARRAELQAHNACEPAESTKAAAPPRGDRAERGAKTSLATSAKNTETQTTHGVLHREPTSRFLKSASVSHFNEASQAPNSASLRVR